MKKLLITIILSSLLLLCGCQTAHNIHNQAIEQIQAKYPYDTIEYLSPAGDTLGSNVHQFMMYSKNLESSFRVYIDNWRDNPIIYENYLSVKYGDEANKEYLNNLNDYINNELGIKNRILHSSLNSTLYPIDMDGNMSFNEWYESISESQFITILVQIDDSTNYDFERIAEMINDFRKTQKFKQSLSVVWMNELAYNFEDNSNEQDLMLIYGGYYARAYFEIGNDNKYEYRWYNTSSDVTSTLQPELYVEDELRVNRLLAQYIAKAEYLEHMDEIEKEREERIENGEIGKIIDEIDTSNYSSMPNFEDLQEKLEQGNKFLEESTFNHLKDNLN